MSPGERPNLQQAGPRLKDGHPTSNPGGRHAADPAERPYIVWDPGMRFGQAMIRRTGVSVEALGGQVWAGDPVKLVAEDFGLTRADVLVACWWLGAHGTKAWRGRWKPWAERVHRELWSRRYDVEDPPTRDGAVDA